ncbi:cyclic nucleotide-binding domain-containing protein [Crocosphaera sp. UHCC 0190]|uniref:cyclic nucleotide-binding domain-containing protein n=1 Tax=Crocosphaera sp. UHCC 0190 TaxID=3110246 RepID=UPI002B1F6F7E|nr:cyclic nucleotide-binding domain-containing protein [Crocosphaera sp. UHCC 0190]MEA5508616.1 cyclic nucleotide-binding domain-containing protein [Crocosphaera sp. UHCC 0190]
MLNPVETVKLFESQPEQTLTAGDIIFREGEKGQVMYGIVEGEVEMFINGKVIEVIQQGDVFGQGALVHEDYLRASTAVAKTNCKLAFLDREHFLFAVQQTPMFALEVMRSYSDRHRRLKRVMDSLGNI